MTNLDDLRLLRAFVRIVESGNISSAARVLNVSQPTLSRQLRQLENVVGVPLIRRDTHTMSLTQAGRTLLHDARNLLGLAESAAERLHEDRVVPRGHIRVVSVVDFGQWIVTKVLARFCETNPEITGELHLLNRPTKFVEEGFDCGISVGEPTDKSVVARKVCTLKRHLVASPKLLARRHTQPKSPSDLRDIPWLGILQPHFYARDRLTLHRENKSCTVTVKPVMLLDGVTALREAARAGAGFTMLPAWLIHQELAAGVLVPILPEWTMSELDLHVVHLPHQRLPGRVRGFVDYCLREIPVVMEDLRSCQKTSHRVA
ncbi:MAG TPA: LysR family transcriptional regulator [Verrucomicrobiae bacterium]